MFTTHCYKFVVAICFFFSIASCENYEAIPPSPEFEVETIIPTGNENYLNHNSDYIFNQDSLYEFYLNIPNTAFTNINNNPAAETYVEGTLTFKGETLSPVGIRYKGSVGAFAGCLDGDNLFEPSGRKTCTKLSMKVKINWQGSDAKFYGLKKLQFHSQNHDATQMHERLGYWLFREMGVPAPRSVHARLFINNVYYGVYALTEQIDGRFTRYNFDDGKGNLYKEVWPLTEEGQAQDEATYLAHLKTNEDDNPSVALMQGFAQDIVAAAEPEPLKTSIANWMNINEIIAYAVVDRAIRNDDGAFHWYCLGEGCNNHNFYWYEEPNNEKIHLIPWDLDNAFENIATNVNPVTPIADNWGVISADCAPFPHGSWGLLQRSAACDKLTRGWTSFNEEYETLKAAFYTSIFSEVSVNAMIDAWANQIRAATIEADERHRDALDLCKWEAAMEKLKNDLAIARAN